MHIPLLNELQTRYVDADNSKEVKNYTQPMQILHVCPGLPLKINVEQREQSLGFKQRQIS